MITQPRRQLRNRSYTCSHCKKHWDKYSTEKTHNINTCPVAEAERRAEAGRQREAAQQQIPFVFREGDICTICQDSEGLDFRLSGCGHAFHKECLTPWVNQFVTKTKEPSCPNCRKGICISECKRLGAQVKPIALRRRPMAVGIQQQQRLQQQQQRLQQQQQRLQQQQQRQQLQRLQQQRLQQLQRLHYVEERKQMIQRILDLYNMGALLFTQYTELMNLTFDDAAPNSYIRQIIREREVQYTELMNESESESDDEESSYEDFTRVFWEGVRYLADEEGDVYDVDGNQIAGLRYQIGTGIVSMTARAPQEVYEIM